jgi:hypothetical protein
MNLDGDLDENELSIFLNVFEELSVTSVGHHREQSGWHNFRHNIQQNASGSAAERRTRAHFLEGLAYEIWEDCRGWENISIQRHADKFTVKFALGNSWLTILSLESDLRIRVRGQEGFTKKKGIPDALGEVINRFVQHWSEQGLEWTEGKWNFWDLDINGQQSFDMSLLNPLKAQLLELLQDVHQIATDWSPTPTTQSEVSLVMEEEGQV